MLELQNVACGYDKTAILEHISLTLCRGELMCLLGPNGVGKTTLFRTILGSLPLLAGTILLESQDLSAMQLRPKARRIAYVPQVHTPPFPFRVLDVVAMGRTPHFCLFSAPTVHDMQEAESALHTMNVSHLRDKSYTEISGGERQLVLIARALAQKAELLVMDEPTANLDFGNQIHVLEHIRSIVHSQQIGVLLTTHSPNHALSYATKVCVIGRNQHFAVGSPHDVISEAYLRETYRIDAELFGVHTRQGHTVRFCIPLAAKSAKSSKNAVEV